MHAYIINHHHFLYLLLYLLNNEICSNMSVGLLVFIVAEIKNSQKLVKTALNIN